MGTGSSTGQGRNTTYGTRDARRYSADNSYWPELAEAQLAESSEAGRNPYRIPAYVIMIPDRHGQTDRQTYRQTDDMQSHNRALR